MLKRMSHIVFALKNSKFDIVSNNPLIFFKNTFKEGVNSYLNIIFICLFDGKIDVGVCCCFDQLYSIYSPIFHAHYF